MAPPTRPTVELRLYGGFQVWCGRGEVHLPRTLQHLVARVAVGGRCPRALLAGELWPDLTERRAQGNLRTSIWQVRRACPGLLVDVGDALALPPDAVVDALRAHAFALAMIRDAAHVPTDALMPHLHALDLLAGWYDDWVVSERDRDRQLRVHALELASGELLRRGVPGAAMHAALAAVQLEPLRESAHRAVIEVHLREGNVALALEVYRLYRKLVATEFGIEPSIGLQHLLGITRAGSRTLVPNAAHNGRPHSTAP